MADKQFEIAFAGTKADSSFYADVKSLLVDEGGENGTTAQLRIALRRGADGSWNYLDDDRFAPFAQLSASIGFAELDALFTGYVTGVEAHFDPDPAKSYLDVSCTDTCALLGLEDKIATWPNLSDSDIVNQVVGGYGVSVQADSTSPVHQDDTTTTVQRSTDLQFVQTLARRNGLEFYFETDTSSGSVSAYLKAPALQGTPQPDLAVAFDENSNLRSFSAKLTAQRPLNVKTAQVDVSGGSTNEAHASDLSLDKLGASDLVALAAAAIGRLATPKDAAAQMLVLGAPSSDQGELQKQAQAVRDEAGWFIEASGEINSDAYQHVLRPHRVVLVKGAGTQYSGKYYVTHVSHSISPEGAYTQSFQARRNARDLDGSESFGASNLALAVPGL
jgi:phage protein D